MRKTILRTLGATLAAKDPYTQMHVLRTQIYAVGVARNMGCSREALRNVSMAALLHDIGKVFLDDAVLRKEGKLDEAEWEQMRRHPVSGEELTRQLKLPAMVLAGIRHHHEKFDGTGYPDGLVDGEIPFVARVLAVADVYDALTSDRCYRRAMGREQALDIVRGGEGTHFDPAVLRVFLRYLPALESEVADLVVPAGAFFGQQLEEETNRLKAA